MSSSIDFIYAQPLPTGASGHKIPYLDVANTWSAAQTISTAGTDLLNLTSSVSGRIAVFNSTDSGAGAIVFDFVRGSASPAASDSVSNVRSVGNNSTPAAVVYGQAITQIVDPTAGSEDSVVFLYAYAAGTIAARLNYSAGVYVGSATGGDKGVDTFNVNTLYEAGTALTAKYGQLATANAWTGVQTISSTVVGTGQLVLSSTDAGGPGMTIIANRATASPAAGDSILSITSNSLNSIAVNTSFWNMFSYITDPTDGSEDSNFYMYGMVAGVLQQAFVFNGTGSMNYQSYDAANSAGPALSLFRDSASPAASDQTGIIQILGRDSTNVQTTYAQIYGQINDPTDGSEDGIIVFADIVAGTSAFRMVVAAGLYMAGVTGGDKGAGTINATSLYEAGTLLTAKYGQLAAGNTWTVAQNWSALNNAFAASTAGTALSFQTTQVSANPISFQFFKQATGAANDYISQIISYGTNDATATIQYSAYQVRITDATAGSEDSNVFIYVQQAGVNTLAFSLGTGLALTGTTGLSVNVGANLPAIFNGVSTDATAGNLVFDISRQSPSPAAADALSIIRMLGFSSTLVTRAYNQIQSVLDDPTNASEDTHFNLFVYIAGVIVNSLVIGNGVYTGGAAGGAKGANTINATTLYEAGVSLAATYGALASANVWSATQTITSTDAGAGTAPVLDLFRNSASPAANDLLGVVNWTGRNSTPATIVYANHYVAIIDPTAATANAYIEWDIMYNGVLGNCYWSVGNGEGGLGWTDPGASSGPQFSAGRFSVSPAANDLIGLLTMTGMDTNSPQGFLSYGIIGINIIDATFSSTDSNWYFQTRVAGTLASRMILTNGLYMAGATGGDKGANTINATTLYEAGTSIAAKYAALSGFAVTGASSIITTAAGTVFSVGSTDAGAGVAQQILDRNSASPAASDVVFDFSINGRDTAAGSTQYGLLRTTILDPTDASEDSQVAILAYAAGAIANRIMISAGVQVGVPTGGDKGAGTLNAVGVYDDNVLLTSQPASAEFLETGTIDVEAWDAIAPTGEHTTARAFKAMLDTGFDPREPEQWVDKFRTDEVLPGMPSKDEFTLENHNKRSIGSIFSDLWLATDMVGVVIGSLTDRLAAAEQKIAELTELIMKSVSPALPAEGITP